MTAIVHRKRSRRRVAATAGLALSLAITGAGFTPATVPALAPTTAIAAQSASGAAIRGVDTTSISGDAFNVASVLDLGGSTLYADVAVRGEVQAKDVEYRYEKDTDEAGIVQLKTTSKVVATHSGDITVSFYDAKTDDRSGAEPLYAAKVYAVAAICNGSYIGSDAADSMIGIRTCAGDATSSFQAPALISKGGRTYRLVSGEQQLGDDGVLRVSYEPAAESGVSASIKYVDSDGNLLQTVDLGAIAEGQVISDYELLDEVEATGKVYVPLKSTAKAAITSTSPEAVITCVERRSPSTAKNAVTIRYVCEQSGGSDDMAWSREELLMKDSVEVGTGGYNYAPAQVFSQSGKSGVMRYTLTGAYDSDGNSYDAYEAASLVLSFNGAKTYTLCYDAEDTVMTYSVSIALVDPAGEGSVSVSREDTITRNFTEDSAATISLPGTWSKDGHVYTLSGGQSVFTYSWSELSEGRATADTAYYVRDDVTTPAAYDVTVRYVDVVSGAELGSTTMACSPDGDSLSIAGPESLDVNGSTYTRLSGQESAIRHSYYAPYRTYTVYYGQPGAFAEGDVYVRRTVIVDGGTTSYTVNTATDAVTTAGATGAAAGTADNAATGTNAAAGGLSTNTPYTTVVTTTTDDNGDATEQQTEVTTPNGNSAGQERIDEDETPLASAETVGTSSLSPVVIGAGVIGIAAAAAVIFAIVAKLRSSQKEA